MYEAQESIFYYLTVGNENYPMPPMPKGVEKGILQGLYRFRPAARPELKRRAQLLGSGAILNEVIQAQHMLDEKYEVAADVWSVTSYKELRRDALDCDRFNLLHPGQEPKAPHIMRCLEDAPGVLVAASDYAKALPDSISRWLSRPLVSLGTDGFGRSDSRRALRDFFEVDARFITLATLYALARDGQIGYDAVKKAVKELDINPDKPDPSTA
jgi:pyruvate dehydrogenase E1 component